MATVFARLWRFLGVRGAFLLAVVTLTLLVPPIIGNAGSSVAELLGRNPMLPIAFIAVIGAMVISALTYSRPGRSRSQAEVLPALRPRAYCVLLRSFGDDGRMLVPQERNRNGFERALSGFTDPNLTIEQVLAGATESRGLVSVGIVDQRSTLVPPGVSFMRARHDEWQSVARRLVSDAHTIVLLLASRGAIRPGFQWEIEMIAAAGLADRVVLVMPPPDRDLALYDRARHDVCRVLSVLDRDGRDPAFFARLMPATAIVCQLVPNSPFPRWWRTEWTRPLRCGRSGFRRVGDTTYDLALHQAVYGNDEAFVESPCPEFSARSTAQSGVVRVCGPGTAEPTPGLLDPDLSRPWSSVARDFLGLAVVVRRRAPRSEFWVVGLVGLLVALVGAGTTTEWADHGGPVPFIYLGLALVPAGCVLARRLHDAGLSPWWALLGTVPVLGLPVLVLAGFRRSTSGTSRSGPVPDSPDWEVINVVGISYIADLLLLWFVLAGVHALVTW